MDLLSFKAKVHETCLQLVQGKIDQLKAGLKSFQDAANEETKSSAGDKYETGRAMMHLEKEKLATQLDQALKQQKVLGQLHADKLSQQVQLGSLVKTDSLHFYISVSLGAIKTNPSVMCISAVAPLGQVLLGKAAGDKVTFNGKNYKILEVA